MKTRILYVLTSDPADFYAEQLFVSITSLRQNSPGAFVSVLTDKATKDQLPHRGKVGIQLLAKPDEWIEAPLDPSLPKSLRSRLLKTNMRKYLDGNFLFLDCDTLITKPLDSLDSCTSDLALCPDHHCPLQEAIDVKDIIMADLRKIGLDAFRSTYYLNSGVIFAKDTPAVRDFFTRWQEEYQKGYQKGVRADQPTLAKTLSESSIPVDLLDGKWNCQLLYGARHLGEAIVFHYFGSHLYDSFQGRPIYILNDPAVLSQIRTSDTLPSSVSILVEDYFKGICPVTHLSGETEMPFWTTRRYRDLRRRYIPGKFSFLEFLLKVRARLPFIK